MGYADESRFHAVRQGAAAAATVCTVSALALSMAGCGASFEGSGSKDAASAEQLALRTDDPWAVQVSADPAARPDVAYRDGVYTGVGTGMDGLITVTLLIDDGRITCIEVTQEGETQSVGGFEAIRDGRYAAMIDAAQGSDIDAVSGATITTAGVKMAVDDALEQAEGQADAAVSEAAAGQAAPGASDSNQATR